MYLPSSDLSKAPRSKLSVTNRGSIFLGCSILSGYSRSVPLGQEGRHLRRGRDVRPTDRHDTQGISYSGRSSQRSKSGLQRGAVPLQKSRTSGPGRSSFRRLRRVERSTARPENRSSGRPSVRLSSHSPPHRGQFSNVSTDAFLQH